MIRREPDGRWATRYEGFAPRTSRCFAANALARPFQEGWAGAFLALFYRNYVLNMLQSQGDARRDTGCARP